MEPKMGFMHIYTKYYVLILHFYGLFCWFYNWFNNGFHTHLYVLAFLDFYDQSGWILFLDHSKTICGAIMSLVWFQFRLKQNTWRKSVLRDFNLDHIVYSNSYISRDQISCNKSQRGKKN